MTLTGRQQMVLDYVRAHIVERQRPPTLRELAFKFRWSVTGANDHLRALIRKGALMRDEGGHLFLPGARLSWLVDAPLLPDADFELPEFLNTELSIVDDVQLARECDAASEERARIVAFLRFLAGAVETGGVLLEIAAERIEAGEHVT